MRAQESLPCKSLCSSHTLSMDVVGSSGQIFTPLALPDTSALACIHNRDDCGYAERTEISCTGANITTCIL